MFGLVKTEKKIRAGVGAKEENRICRGAESSGDSWKEELKFTLGSHQVGLSNVKLDSRGT